MKFRVHLLKHKPDPDHLLELTYNRYLKNERHFPNIKVLKIMSEL